MLSISIPCESCFLYQNNKMSVNLCFYQLLTRPNAPSLESCCFHGYQWLYQKSFPLKPPSLGAASRAKVSDISSTKTALMYPVISLAGGINQSDSNTSTTTTILCMCSCWLRLALDLLPGLMEGPLLFTFRLLGWSPDVKTGGWSGWKSWIITVCLNEA